MPASETSQRWFMTTARLGFRCWSDADMDLAHALWGDPRVTRLIDARDRLTPDDVRKRLDLEIATAAEHGFQYWPMFLLESGAFVGCCGVKPLVGATAGEMMLGFYLRPEYWGMGLASEAARAAVDRAFGELGLTVLYAGHHPGNHASGAVLRKVGFEYLRDDFFAPTGLMHPFYVLRVP